MKVERRTWELKEAEWERDDKIKKKRSFLIVSCAQQGTRDRAGLSVESALFYFCAHHYARYVPSCEHHHIIALQWIAKL